MQSITEPTLRRDLLDWLAEEEVYVTVYTGIMRLEGFITKDIEGCGWRVSDHGSHYDLFYVPIHQEGLMEDLKIVFEADGSVVIYPTQVL